MSNVRKTDNSSGSADSKVDGKLLDALKHYNSFYQQPPPGLIKEEHEDRPEDVIPDTPENSSAREFLAKAPTKGLWMPLGKEVKVMKCWRCKIYGHRSGDKECPMFMSGNQKSEELRSRAEDPMYFYVKESEMRQKLEKVEMLKSLLHDDDKKKKRRDKKEHKRKRKHRDSSSSDSDSSRSTSSSSSSSSSDSSHKKRKKVKKKMKKKLKKKMIKRNRSDHKKYKKHKRSRS